VPVGKLRTIEVIQPAAYHMNRLSQMISRPRLFARSFLLLAGLAMLVTAQTPAGDTGVIRLRVRVSTGDGSKAKGLSRKRFFLVKGSLEQNQSLIKGLEQRPVLGRDCYYRSIGASEALITWLKQNDCESVYCREVAPSEAEGAAAVPEFAHAFAAGEREYGNRELARKWLSVNLPENIRNGFYKRQQLDFQALLARAAQESGAKVMSVMTDRNGTAYFTDVEPGLYVITNILPAEVGSSSELWSCEVKVVAGDLAAATREKPYLITDPNNKDPKDKRNIKCVSLERPLPTCQPAP
jgi:hypothetical protein